MAPSKRDRSIGAGAALPEPAIGDTPASAEVPQARLPNQAVVVVHGMGEQRPMETIRRFVHAVWSTDISLTEGLHGRRTNNPDGSGEINKSWIVPDLRTASHELRRITTPADINGRRTDFYELYWADVTQGTTLQRLTAWMKGLLLRRWSEIPADAMKLYIAAWVAVVVLAGPTIVLWAIYVFDQDSLLWSAAVWTILAAIVAGLLTYFIVPYLGDVAAYVSAEPDTVVGRSEVRERGLALLKPLMEDPAYDRIVLVSHSLGSVVAYDLLQILWAEYGPNHRNARQEPAILDALRKVGKFSLPLASADRDAISFSEQQLADFRVAQWNLFSELAKTPESGSKPWKISDFVTFGSPLTHAEFLISRNRAAFQRGLEERLFASCPPISERKTPTVLYADRYGRQHAHHAAVFAATRWTNVFDIGNLWSTGDPVSGSMRENFGPGVAEIRVRLRWKLLGFWTRIFTHTQYWAIDAQGDEFLPSGEVGKRSHIDILRYAVDLGRRPPIH